MKLLFLIITVCILSGCTGRLDYTPPTNENMSAANYKIIDKPRETVWNTSVPELGKRFFVINNLDKSSGLINLSYSGNPEEYIDCGRIISYVKNARGERTYDFAASKAQESYEIMNGNGLFFIDRKMSLEGRVNLVFEEISPQRTKVTANTRYVVEREQAITSPGDNIPQTNIDSISFNSGSSSSFDTNKDGRATECVATGALEHEILSIIK